MSDEHIPQYVDEITDMTDPRQVLAWALAEWPAFGKQQPMPTNLVLTPFQSEHLSKLGIRFDPSLAVLWKVRDPKSGLAKFVDADELAEMDLVNTHPPHKPSTMEKKIEDMLTQVTADLSKQVENLSDEERLAKAEQMAPVMEESLRLIAGMRKELGLPDDAS